MIQKFTSSILNEKENNLHKAKFIKREKLNRMPLLFQIKTLELGYIVIVWVYFCSKENYAYIISSMRN